MRDIERTLRRGASTPQTRSSKGKIEKHVLEVQQLLDTLNALGSLPDENLCAVEHDSTLGSFHDATTTLSPGEGVSSPPSLTFCGTLITLNSPRSTTIL